jgi:hypothetical protein
MSTAPFKESPSANEITVVSELYSKYKDLDTDVAKLLNLDTDTGIAVGKPVRDSGGTEQGGDPRHAVDGSIFGSYWAASPAPQWIEVDLQRVAELYGAHLFPYYGDDRLYQYKIEVSKDGTNWRTTVDASGNRVKATIAGYRHEWPPVEARYIRVTMLKNSANIGVHLHELKVLGK